MITYDGQNLFSSGPAHLASPGRQLRTREHAAPGVDGVRLTILGRAPKRLTQRGRLVADNAVALYVLMQAIEAVMDGRAADLVNEHGQTHANMVMTRFESVEAINIGRDASIAYEIEYVEAT